MSFIVADNLTNETGYHVEWSPANQEYVVWPAGVPCRRPKHVKAVCRDLKAAEEDFFDYVELAYG